MILINLIINYDLIINYFLFKHIWKVFINFNITKLYINIFNKQFKIFIL